jgi:hypothetical protein
MIPCKQNAIDLLLANFKLPGLGVVGHLHSMHETVGSTTSTRGEKLKSILKSSGYKKQVQSLSKLKVHLINKIKLSLLLE